MPTEGMVQIPAGEFLMGSEEFYPEEGPVRRVAVDGFWMDEHAVTAADFRRFVRETGYVTVAERPLDPADYPDADPELLVPGALVFRQTTGPVPLNDFRNWWEYVPGAYWKRPGGPGHDDQRPRPAPGRPGRLRGRGGLRGLGGEGAADRGRVGVRGPRRAGGQPFAWGDEHFPDGQPAANTWQGEFPWQNLKLDGHEGTSPVGSFAPNGYGLYDMTGNTWEWTTDFFTAGNAEGQPACCAPTLLPGETFPRRVIKGGSHLCAPNYCLRYRPAARQGEAVDTSTGHIGFRCIVRGEES